jgi:hypothetical protein
MGNIGERPNDSLGRSAGCRSDEAIESAGFQVIGTTAFSLELDTLGSPRYTHQQANLRRGAQHVHCDFVAPRLHSGHTYVREQVA